MPFPFSDFGAWRRGAALALVCAAPAVLAQPTTTLYAGESGAQLASSVRAGYTPVSTLGYNAARDELYAYEQQTDGALRGIYTGFSIQLTPGADPSTDAFNKGINCEHTWPQSLGAGAEPAKSDLHHLFPAKDNVNSSRSNHPFDEIPDAQADGWYRLAASQSTVPTANLAEWSEKDNDHPNAAYTGRFEPRESVKGDIARAAIYFYTIYNTAADDAFWNAMKDVLLMWHAADPVDLEEYNRSEWIRTKQGKANPFILDPTLASRIYGDGTTPPPPPPPGPDPDPEPEPVAGDLWINELHYDNDGTDADEGVEIAGAAGVTLDGWSLVAYNGNGGTAYASVYLSGQIDEEGSGYGAVWVPISGLQNGSPDGLALVDASGQVAQFLSYEGAMSATDGAAAGASSTDVGVAETSATPVGHSLQLTGTGSAYADFAWQAPAAASRGWLNAGQVLSGGTPPPPPPPPPPPAVAAWINELHYDDRSADSDEGVEVAGTAGLDLAGWSLVAYNGADGTAYATVSLSGTLADQQAGLGTKWFAMAGLQNGGPDGVALVDGAGAVVQFLSYEGSFAATDGPAAGAQSEDIGVAEDADTRNGYSLQLGGTGSAYADFAWQTPKKSTHDGVNRGQTLTAPAALAASDERPSVAPLALSAFPNPTAGAATVAVQTSRAGRLSVAVYDVLGREVARLHDGAVEAGAEARLAFDASALPAGLYVVRAASAAGVATTRVTVAR